MSYLPGLVFALGGRSPGHPTFLLGTDGYYAYSKIALGFSSESRLKRAFVLSDSVDDDKPLSALLATAGLDFPARYRFIGEASGLGKTFRLYKPLD